MLAFAAAALDFGPGYSELASVAGAGALALHDWAYPEDTKRELSRADVLVRRTTSDSV